MVATTTTAKAPVRSALGAAIGAADALRLVAVVQELALARDVTTIADVVRRGARSLTGSDGATFVLKDEGHCYYVDEDAIGPLWKGQRFPLQTCISGWTMLHEEAVAVADIYLDDRIPHSAYRPTFVKSLAMVPVRRPEPVAAIGLYWAKRHEVTPTELELIQALADAAAVAMTNASLNRELETSAERLARAEERLGFALEAGGIGTWDWRLGAGELLWDERTRAHLGVTADVVPSLDVFVGCVHADDRVAVQAAADRALDGASGGAFHAEYRTADGERWLSARGRVTFDAVGAATRFTGTLTDVTQRRRAQASLEASLKMRDEFLIVAGHELRTPVMALLLQLESSARALEIASIDPKLLSRVSRSVSHAKRLGRLVDDLLDVASIGSGRMTFERAPVDLTRVVNDAAALFADAARASGCRLVVDAAPGITVVGDVVRLEQVIANLLSNAFRYGKGTPVEITLDRQESMARLRVADRGIGIAEDFRGKIFARFERGVSTMNYGGLGLGLWIVRQIVDAHHGTIDVTSRPGEGACFTALFPLT